MLDWAGESQYYVEPKRLAKLGYLEARKEPGKTRDRTVYTLTDKGLEALREWARTPVGFTPVKSELLVRLLIADLVGEEATRAERPRTPRDEIADLEARIVGHRGQRREPPPPPEVPAPRGRVPARPAGAPPRADRRGRAHAGSRRRRRASHLAAAVSRRTPRRARSTRAAPCAILPTTSASGAGTTSMPRKAAIWPNRPCSTRSAASRPKRVASTRS